MDPQKRNSLSLLVVVFESPLQFEFAIQQHESRHNVKISTIFEAAHADNAKIVMHIVRYNNTTFIVLFESKNVSHEQ